MRDRYIPAFIMLIAGAITCIFDIYHKTDLLTSLKKLLIVLIIFYMLGKIARAIINKALIPKPNNNEDETEDTTEDNSENNAGDSKEDTTDGKKEENSENKEENKKL